VGRYWLSLMAARAWDKGFPWGTLIVNVTGSFAIGFFAALCGPGGRWVDSPRSALFLMTGICGGYTTFSAFSLQTLRLMEEGRLGPALLNIAASIVLCLVAVWLGHLIGRLFQP
jgi:CrcB protein